MTSEFTHCNLVIRLRKAKQSPFRLSVFCDVSLILSSLENLLNLHFYSAEAALNYQKRSFFTVAQATDATCNMTHEPGRYMPFRCGISSS